MPVNLFNNSSSNEDTPRSYAGFSVRAVASIIDFAIFFPLIGLSTYNQLNIKSLSLELTLVAISMLYKPLMEWKYQATLGKMVTKIKVIAEVGGPMTLAQSFIRSMIFMGVSIVSALISIDVFNNPDFQNVKTADDIVAFQDYLNYSSAQDSLGLILIMAISFVIFDPRNQGVHDKMARSLVVY